MEAAYDHLVFTDDQKFWEIVCSTKDFLEAEQMLRGARLAVITAKKELLHKKVHDHELQVSLDALLSRINDELHWLSQRITMSDWRSVVTELWGEEGLAQVRMRLVLISDERETQRKKHEQR